MFGGSIILRWTSSGCHVPNLKTCPAASARFWTMLSLHLTAGIQFEKTKQQWQNVTYKITQNSCELWYLCDKFYKYHNSELFTKPSLRFPRCPFLIFSPLTHQFSADHKLLAKSWNSAAAPLAAAVSICMSLPTATKAHPHLGTAGESQEKDWRISRTGSYFYHFTKVCLSGFSH